MHISLDGYPLGQSDYREENVGRLRLLPLSGKRVDLKRQKKEADSKIFGILA